MPLISASENSKSNILKSCKSVEHLTHHQCFAESYRQCPSRSSPTSIQALLNTRASSLEPKPNYSPALATILEPASSDQPVNRPDNSSPYQMNDFFYMPSVWPGVEQIIHKAGHTNVTTATGSGIHDQNHVIGLRQN